MGNAGLQMAPTLLRLLPHMRFATSFLLLFLPVTALSQTQASLEIAVNGEESVVLSSARCGESIQFRYTTGAGMALTICKNLEIWLTTSATCESAPPDGAVIETIGTPLSDAGEFTKSVASLPPFGGDQAACTSQQIDQTWRVCGTYAVPQVFGGACSSATDAVIRETTPPTIRFDSLPPEPPEIVSVGALDNAVSVQLQSPSDDTVEVVVTATPVAGGPPGTASTAEVDGTVTIGDLVNGAEYAITAVARDDAGNESAPSAPSSGTPIATGGLFERYVAAGGEEQGGCSSAGVATSGLLPLLVGFWFLGRRRSCR